MKPPLALLLSLGLLAPLPPTRADLPPDILSQVTKTHQDSLLFLGGQVKFLCGRCPQEHPLQILSSALVVHTNGLFLATALGPLADPKLEIRASTLRVRCPDGAELPVRLALTDQDLGLMVLTLEKPEDAKSHPLKPLNLEDPVRAKTLDQLVILRRHDAGLEHIVSATAVQVSALQTKPRYEYYPSGAAPTPDIAPCFNPQGQLVGIVAGTGAALAADELSDLLSQAAQKSSSPKP